MNNIIDNIEVYSMLVFEDESGNIYQDCVVQIIDIPSDIRLEIRTNSYYIDITRDTNEIMSISGHHIFDREKECWIGLKTNFKLKEIWTRTNEDTYKKIWENK